MHTENRTDGQTDRNHCSLVPRPLDKLSVGHQKAAVHFTKSQKPLSIPAVDRQNNRIAIETTKTYLNVIKYRCPRKYVAHMTNSIYDEKCGVNVYCNIKKKQKET